MVIRQYGPRKGVVDYSPLALTFGSTFGGIIMAIYMPFYFGLIYPIPAHTKNSFRSCKIIGL